MNPMKVNANRNMSIALVSMPFASYLYPSLGLSILKPILREIGCEVSIRYYNMLYAKMIGSEVFSILTGDQTYNIGEQAFAHLLFPERNTDDEFNHFLSEMIAKEKFKTLVARAEELVDFAADELLEENPHIIGFTTTFYQKMAALALANKLRIKGYQGLIVLGGAACESPMGEALIESFSCIDAVFHGDSEETFPAFINSILHKGSISDCSGVTTRKAHCPTIPKKNETPLNKGKHLATPLPDYQDFIASLKKFELNQEPWFLSYEASRGCWWGEKNHCTFCGLNGSQMKFRSKSIENIISDLKKIKNIYGEVFVQFTDNIMHFDFVKLLLPKLEEIEGQQYFFEVKSNLKENDFIHFYRAGVSEIQPGIERLNDRALLLMKKGVSAIQNIHILRLAAEYGIRVGWNILYGFPGEDADSISAEIEVLNSLTHFSPPGSCAKIRLDRYSPNFNYAHEKGFVISGPSRAEKFLFYKIANVDTLAYHFSYQYITNVDARVLSGWTELEACVKLWRESFQPGLLIQYHEGHQVIIRDLRNKEGVEHVLNGESAEIYSTLETPRTENYMSQNFQNFSYIADQLLKQRLIVKIGTRYVSIAVRNSDILQINNLNSHLITTTLTSSNQ